MPMQLDTGAIKAESRSLLRTGEVNPFRMTLFYLLITLVLDMINSGVSYMIDSVGGFTVLSFSFVSILVGLVALVLNAGYYCYCFGILRREEMPYESLFDAFPLCREGHPAFHRRGRFHLPVVDAFRHPRHHRGLPLPLRDV